MNATKHGERSADRVAARRETHELLRALREMDRAEEAVAEIESMGAESIRLWDERIDRER